MQSLSVENVPSTTAQVVFLSSIPLVIYSKLVIPGSIATDEILLTVLMLSLYPSKEAFEALSGCNDNVKISALSAEENLSITRFV